MSASPGFEEHVLKGINKVCKGVRVFGSSSGNDLIIDGAQDAPWQIYGSLAGWGASRGGVSAMAIWLHDTTSMHNVLLHCYGPEEHSGMITNAQGRDILEIDGCLASNIFLDWTGLSLPLKTKELAQYSLAFNDRLVDVMGISKDGVLNCYASTAADLGHCQVSILSIKPSDVIGAIKQVARAAKESVGFDVRGFWFPSVLVPAPCSAMMT